MSKAAIHLQQWPNPMQWINCDQEIPWRELRGRVVLLYFWNAWSVYCQNALAEVKALEARFQDGLAVIGVHVPVSAAERKPELLLKAVNRQHIRFPVVSDGEWILWRQLAIGGWPSFALIDAAGAIDSIYLGESRRAELETRIEALLDRAQQAGIRRLDPLPRVRKPEPNATLQFPARITADEQRIYLSDGGRNRILELNLDGRITRVFGSGNAGLWDGRLAEAGFNQPQGLAVGKEYLWVADTGNHAIRRVRLLTGDVETWIGTGKCGRMNPGEAPKLSELSLCAPSDVAVAHDRLYIAATGTHQILALDLARNTLRIAAGTGKEEVLDGFAAFAGFAQPEALSAGRDALYIADAAGHAIRVLRFVDERVQTLIYGKPFEPGDADGAPGTAKLNHPRGICFDGQRGVLWITDALNGKLKVYALAKGETKTLGLSYALSEPSGLALAGGALWIVNGNAHELLKLDLRTGKMLRVPIAG